MHRAGAGLTPEFPSPIERLDSIDIITEEAAVQMPGAQTTRVTPLVQEGDLIAKGAAVACLRHAPDICLVAPIAGRVAQISVIPGRRLSEIVLFREDQGGIQRHGTVSSESPAALRRLMQAAGVWPWIRRRPFGGMPAPNEAPAAIVVMAADTRPYAPSPMQALEGREEAFARGLAALGQISRGPVFVCWPRGMPAMQLPTTIPDVRWISCGSRHPQASPGIRIHRDIPAGLDTPVWDMHAEDVAALGDLLETGELPMQRRIRISGAGLREGRSLRTHPGADLRQLTQHIVASGPHILMSGGHLDGRAARWLGQRHRQVTVLPRTAQQQRRHWLIHALTKSATLRPVIPTAALTQSFGAVLPAPALIRALGAGDSEAAMALGALSLLEDDVALADYVLGAGGEIMLQLRSLLDHIQAEYAG
ncbi:Na+-transporting NADH:ubiquinone oxidoreductase subunit A [Jannaschia pohangensis]|uniref:Na+-transporting NADH:ubiquinone oxidoreductase subunit A n=2 Tax=Jannaschia pohangensis TaxID=390807 RepID=A0A1I3H672_9RHOB|nr:Na+-transporting NADH:ubiquinone oxidoreductase subunit A [Jannaschia pohangensis]